MIIVIIIVIVKITTVYVNRKVCYLCFFNCLFRSQFFLEAIPDPQMQTWPAYGTREEFFMRNVTNNTLDYDYIK